jgi:FKBP-type peptidyl-prolyl cis-trans isomerase
MIVAPPSVAYGTNGNPQGGIPKNATLVFVVDILGTSG